MASLWTHVGHVIGALVILGPAKVSNSTLFVPNVQKPPTITAASSTWLLISISDLTTSPASILVLIVQLVRWATKQKVRIPIKLYRCYLRSSFRLSFIGGGVVSADRRSWVLFHGCIFSLCLCFLKQFKDFLSYSNYKSVNCGHEPFEA